MNQPPPPPPPPGYRGPGNFAGQPPPPPPPPNVHPPPPPPPPGHPGPGGPPFQMQMQMPMRQQSIRVSDISPPKVLDENACLKKLTTYHAFTLRKVTPRDRAEVPTWARAEVVEERLAEDDITREIKQLAKERKTVTEKKTVLGPNLQNQITTLIDDLASKDPERGTFDWSLVQFTRTEKPVPCEKRQKQKWETLTCTVFVKRAPVRGINPIMLYRQLENMKTQRVQPPPPPPPQPQPQPQPQHPPEHHGGDHGRGGDQGGDFFDLGREGPPKPRKIKAVKGKHGNKGYHRDRRSDSSSYSSGPSDSDSDSDSYADSLTDTSISSSTGSRESRGRRHNRSPKRSYSKHRASPQIHQYRIESGPQFQIPIDQRPEAYGISNGRQPYAPETPRASAAADPRLTQDALATAYFAGKEDQKTEQYAALPRSPPPPRVIERVIEREIPVNRLLEPRAVVSYRRSEPRYPSPFAGQDARDQEARERLHREAEAAQDYMERTRDFPIRGLYADRREFDERAYRRPPPTMAPLVNRPFGVVPSPARHYSPPRRYAPSSDLSSGW